MVKTSLFHDARCFASYTLRRTFTSPKPYIVLAALTIYLMRISGFVREYLAQKDWTMNGLEFFILMSNDTEAYFFIWIALIFLISDCPYAPPGTGCYLIRSSRTGWFLGQLLYLLEVILLFNLYLMAVCTVALLPHLAIGLDWSTVVRNTPAWINNRDFSFAFGIYPIFALGELAKLHSFLELWFMALRANILWMFALCSLSLALALFSSVRLGFLAVGGAIALYRVDMAIDYHLISRTFQFFDFVYLTRWITRWYDTRLQTHALGLFLTIIVLSCLLGWYWAKRYDFSL